MISTLFAYLYKDNNMKCKYCNKELKNDNALRQHQIRCNLNSNKIAASGGALKGKNTGQIPWNKGKVGIQEAWNKGKKCPQISGNQGGLRQGSGRGKSGWYKDYWCDSSWELAYVIYNLEHDIKFDRNKEGFEYIYEGKEYKYYPDFIVGGKYIEVKGYMDKKNEAKHNQFNGELEILEKEKIKPYLEYVIGKYGKEYIKMYE